MAVSSYKTFLMMKGSGNDATYAKLVDIKDYPDMGGKPEMLETTTLSDKAQTYTEGIDSSEALEFTANYTKTDFTTLAALKGVEHEFAVWFGGTESGGVVTPTGEDGKFEFKGKLSVTATGNGVNEVREMSISIATTTPVNPVMS